MLRTKVISLNAGGPETLEWNGQSAVTSMRKRQIQGDLNVLLGGVEGDSFANGKLHGLSHSAVYIYGLSSIRDYLSRLALNSYEPGALGENLTVEHLDESEVSAGDVFEVGGVTLEATFPRIPCAKLNIRMQHADGQKKMIACGRSGIYFRVLVPGAISPGSDLVRVHKADVQVPITELYARIACGKGWNESERIKEVLQNRALPERLVSDLTKHLTSS
jgi:MOSC domain-containing protein YiiM